MKLLWMLEIEDKYTRLIELSFIIRQLGIPIDLYILPTRFYSYLINEKLLNPLFFSHNFDLIKTRNQSMTRWKISAASVSWVLLFVSSDFVLTFASFGDALKINERLNRKLVKEMILFSKKNRLKLGSPEQKVFLFILHVYM